MGYNATVVVMVDALEHIERDTKFGATLSRAIREHMSGSARPGRTDIISGSHYNAAHVVEVHHSGCTSVITVGGNLGVQQLLSYGGGQHVDEEARERLLREWAAKMGYDLVRKEAEPVVVDAEPAVSSPPVPAYLLVLSDHKMTTARLVTGAVWNWIHSSFDSAQGHGYMERVPTDVLAEVEKEGDSGYIKDRELHISCGSYENDRALAAPGHEFDDVMAAMEYARIHNFDVKETFNGCIY
jgi:hypothetical protein